MWGEASIRKACWCCCVGGAILSLGAGCGRRSLSYSDAAARVGATTVELRTLASGLRVVLEQHDNPELAGAILIVDAGETCGGTAKEGLARLASGLSLRRPGAQQLTVFQRLSAIGATIDTAFDVGQSWFGAFANADSALELAAAMSDIVEELSSAIDAATFEQERVSVALGAESLPALSHESVQRFITECYRPHRSTLYLRLPKQRPELTREIWQHLSTQAAKNGKGFERVPDVAVARPRKPVVNSGLRLVTSGFVQKPTLWLTWEIPYSSIAEKASAEVLVSVVEQALLAYAPLEPRVSDINCALERAPYRAAIQCRAATDETRQVEPMIVRVIDGIRRFVRSSPKAESAVESWKARWGLYHLMMSEDPRQSGSRIAYGTHFFGEPRYDQKLAAAVAIVDPDELLAQGNNLLQRATVIPRLVTATRIEYVPSSFPDAVPSWRPSDPIVVAASSWQTAADVEHLAPSFARIHRNPRSEFRLGNGLHVQVIRMPGSPFMAAMLAFRGGRAWAPLRAIGEASEIAELSPADDPTSYGVLFSSRRLPDAQLESVRGPLENFDHAIQYLAQRREPRFEWPKPQYRRNLSWYILREADPRAKAMGHRLSALFGDHAYALDASAEELLDVSAAQIRDYLGSLRRPDNATLTLVGDLSESDMRQSLESHFADWQAPTTPKIRPPAKLAPRPNPSDGPEFFITNYPATSQTEVSWSCLVPAASPRELVRAALAMATVRILAEERLREAHPMSQLAGFSNALALGFTQLAWTVRFKDEDLAQALASIVALRPETLRDTLPRGLALAQQTHSYGDIPTSTIAPSLADIYAKANHFGCRLEEVEQIPAYAYATTPGEVFELLEGCWSRLKIGLLGDDVLAAAAVARCAGHP